MAATEVRFESQGHALAGSLTLPDQGDPVAAALMLHGSGPLDRDENTRRQRLDIFNVLAEALAGSAIASLRYDKRGCGGSKGNYSATGFHDLIEDATAAFDTLSSHVPLRPLFLLGHSEGTLLAPALAARRGEVAGLVLLCPTVAPMEVTLMAQAARLATEVRTLPGLSGIVARAYFALRGGVAHTQRRLIERVRSSKEDTLRAGLARIPAKWLRELLAHDPEAAVTRLTAPVLCISGGKDIQCDPQDGHRIAALAKAPVDVHIVPDLTHILRRDDQPASFMRYRALLAQPMDAAVVDLACDWLLRRCRTQPV
jgi:alpha-beta hydrolase superfamily lysophospholipase